MNSLSFDISNVFKTNIDTLFLQFAEVMILNLSRKYNFDHDDAMQYINNSLSINYQSINEKKPIEIEQKPIEIEQKPIEIEQKPIEIEQKPIEIEQKPNKKNKKTFIKPNIVIPFCNQINNDWCFAIRLNHGLYTQCTNPISKNIPITKHNFCNTCFKQTQKNENYLPNYGLISDRIDSPDWTFKGKKPIIYAKIIEKLNINKNDAINEANRFGFVIPEEQLIIPDKKKSGRPKRSTVSIDNNTQKSSKKSSKKSSEKSSVSIDNNTQKSSEKSSVSIDNNTQKSPEKSSQKSPEKSSQKSSEKSSVSIDNNTQKSRGRPKKTKTIVNHADKIISEKLEHISKVNPENNSVDILIQDILKIDKTINNPEQQFLNKHSISDFEDTILTQDLSNAIQIDVNQSNTILDNSCVGIQEYKQELDHNIDDKNDDKNDDDNTDYDEEPESNYSSQDIFEENAISDNTEQLFHELNYEKKQENELKEPSYLSHLNSQLEYQDDSDDELKEDSYISDVKSAESSDDDKTPVSYHVFDGIEYYKDEDNILYDIDTNDPIAKWDPITLTTSPIFDSIL